MRNLDYWSRLFLTWPLEQQMRFVRWRLRTLRSRIPDLFGSAFSGLRVDDLVDLTIVTDNREREIGYQHVRIFNDYNPEPLDGAAILHRTRGHQMFSTFDADYGWSEFTPHVQTVALRGDLKSFEDNARPRGPRRHVQPAATRNPRSSAWANASDRAEECEARFGPRITRNGSKS